MTVADANARESGVEAMRNTPGYDPGNGMPMHSPYGRPPPPTQHSTSSLTPLGAAAFPPGITTPQSRSVVSRSPPSTYQEPYADQPYRYSQYIDPNLAEFDPNSIEDDGDDGLEYRQRDRSSMMSLGHGSSDRAVPTAAGAAGGAAAGGIMGALGGIVGKNGSKTSPQYDPVNGPYGPQSYNLGEGQEKSEWLSKQSTGTKKLRLFVIFLSVLLIVGAIAGGIIGGILGSKAKSKSNAAAETDSAAGQSASADSSANGELDKNSAEIKKLLGNKNLHKVFPGIDYTPMYTQYPDCLNYPPSQNNVTRDVAVLSQLSNTIRLYGTDCNQTEMVLTAIDRLGLNGTTKVWMGIWQDSNTTTNARQLEQAYKIFANHGAASFAGVIVGNEVLFRKDLTIANLSNVIDDVRKHMDTNGIKLPIASSDLGDNWTQAFADKVDILMANIHPFFAGQTADVAAGWTWSFWQNKDIPLKTDITKNYIAETGWPTKGGKDCGEATTCTTGSVAGITELNTFMNTWICPSLANGTNYFWFEAFDEPWKIKFNEPGKEWEDQWGLMDVNRNLKPGVLIPDCGGKTAA